MLVKNYKSKCNYRIWEKRKGHFWSLRYLLEGTGLSYVVLGFLAFYLVPLMQRHDRLPIFPPAPGLGKAGALLVERPAELTLHA